MKAFFVFSGQGAQTVGMGADFAARYPESQRIFAEADAVLGYSLSEICFQGPAETLTQTRYCQVAIYTMSVAALAAFRAKFGTAIQPVACAGLSLGEYAALYAGQAFSFAEGLKLLARRAELMDAACAASDGTMASVLGGDRATIKEIAGGCDIDVANYNSPGQIVISGDRVQVGRAIELLKEKNMRKVIPLNVAGAFHSRLMKPAAVGLKSALNAADIALPALPVYHNYTAEVAASVADLKANLAAQVAGSVRWEECVRAMVGAGGDTMIEFGPGNVLTGLLRRTLPEIPGYNVNSVEGLEALPF